MSLDDEQLLRLFRAARSTPGALEPRFPYGLETRVLAAWRARETFELWTPAVLTRGLIAAIALAAISLVPLLNQTSNPYSDYQQLADSTLSSSSLP